MLMVSADGQEVDEVIQAEQCRHQVIPFTRNISPIRDCLNLFRLLLLFRKYKPDIVHTHTPKAGLLGMLAGWITGVPVRLHTIAGLPLMTLSGWKQKLMILTERLTGWAAHWILPNSKSMEEELLQRKLAPRTKLKQIGVGSSNGISLEKFNREALNVQKIDQVRSSVAKPGDRLILFVGRLVTDKGVAELVSAFTEMDLENVVLLLLGPIEHTRQSELLPELILDKIEKDKRIFHFSWSDEVEYYLAACDFLVHPSHREGFPNVLLQAAAMKTPIVCSGIPGNIDIVSSSDLGYLHKVSNKQSLTEAMTRALAELDGGAKVKAEKLWSEIADKYERKAFHANLHEFYLEQMKEHV